MFKRWFSSTEAEFEEGAHRNGAVDRAPVAVERSRDFEPVREPPGGVSSAMADGASSAVLGKFAPFDEIYRGAPVKPPKVPYGILKVAEMMNSPHLVGLSPAVKRASLLMAFDAAGVQLEDLLQDAMVRQRALNEYEDGQQKRLKEFEAGKAKENEVIQAEINRVNDAHTARIQSNLDEVARQEDSFRAWKKRKQQESEVIAEAAALCAPLGNANNPGSLAASLARYGAEAVVGKGA
jgi:hypothetical protein